MSDELGSPREIAYLGGTQMKVELHTANIAVIFVHKI
jgi:hypothetical protein